MRQEFKQQNLFNDESPPVRARAAEPTHRKLSDFGNSGSRGGMSASRQFSLSDVSSSFYNQDGGSRATPVTALILNSGEIPHHVCLPPSAQVPTPARASDEQTPAALSSDYGSTVVLTAAADGDDCDHHPPRHALLHRGHGQVGGGVQADHLGIAATDQSSVIACSELPSAKALICLDEFAKIPKKPTVEQLEAAEPHRPLTAREETEADPNLDIRSSKHMRMSKEEPRFAKSANVRNAVTYSGGVLSNAKPLYMDDYASLGNVATKPTTSGTCASGLTNNLPDSLPKSSLIKSGLADERGEPSSVSLGNRDSFGATDQPEEPSDMSPRAPLSKFSYEELERLCLLQKNSGRNLAFLRGLRRHLGRDENCGAKGDLECDDVIADYINSKSVVSHHNLRCALRFVRRLVVTEPEDGFQQLIDYAITRWRGGGGTIQGLANEIGLDKQRLTAYARSNARPKPQSLDGLIKLEKLSELPSGSLTKYARTSNTGHVFGQFNDLSNPLYSWRPIFRKLATLGPNLIDQLQRYCAFKTSKLHRQRIELPDGSSRQVARVGAWTPSLGTFDPPNCGKSFEEWRNFSTVTPFVTVVRTVYTYARSHHAVDCDTMAILMDIELIGEMLAEDVQLRGAFHSGHEVIIVTLASLMHPKHGYLTQLPEIFFEEARNLGMNVELKDWASFIAEKYAAVQQLAASLAPNRVRGRRSLRSRDKKKKLSAFLNCDDAYGTHVFPALLRMEEERPPCFAPNSVRLDYEVSLLTFVLFAACPLRKLNWVTAEWDKNLRRDKGGSWWVHVPLDQLKNRRFLDQDLDLILPNWAAERVEYYYQNVRERMTSVNANASRYVMAGPNISAKRRKPGKRGRLPPTALIYSVVGRRMNRMTKRIWNLSLSPHDWRDIFATDYLHKHNDSLMTVAMILNDKPETILAEYAKPSSIRFSKLAAKIMDQEYKLAVEARKRILTRGSITKN